MIDQLIMVTLKKIIKNNFPDSKASLDISNNLINLDVMKNSIQYDLLNHLFSDSYSQEDMVNIWILVNYATKRYNITLENTSDEIKKKLSKFARINYLLYFDLYSSISKYLPAKSYFLTKLNKLKNDLTLDKLDF